VCDWAQVRPSLGQPAPPKQNRDLMAFDLALGGPHPRSVERVQQSSPKPSVMLRIYEDKAALGIVCNYSIRGS